MDWAGTADTLDGAWVRTRVLEKPKEGDEAIKDYSKSQEIETVILGVDIDRQRISLGIKQLSDDQFEVFLTGIKRGGVVKGNVVDINAGAAMVELADGVQARLALREVPRENDALKIGDEVEAKVIEINRKRRQVDLSVRQQLRDEERDAMRSYSQELSSEQAPSALALELQRKLLDKK